MQGAQGGQKGQARLIRRRRGHTRMREMRRPRTSLWSAENLEWQEIRTDELLTHETG